MKVLIIGKLKGDKVNKQFLENIKIISQLEKKEHKVTVIEHGDITCKDPEWENISEGVSRFSLRGTYDILLVAGGHGDVTFLNDASSDRFEMFIETCNENNIQFKSIFLGACYTAGLADEFRKILTDKGVMLTTTTTAPKNFSEDLLNVLRRDKESIDIDITKKQLEIAAPDFNIEQATELLQLMEEGEIDKIRDKYPDGISSNTNTSLDPSKFTIDSLEDQIRGVIENENQFNNFKLNLGLLLEVNNCSDKTIKAIVTENGDTEDYIDSIKLAAAHSGLSLNGGSDINTELQHRLGRALSNPILITFKHEHVYQDLKYSPTC